jgi:hypothetical protein
MHPLVAAGFITNVSHDRVAAAEARRAVKPSAPAPREPRPRTP